MVGCFVEIFIRSANYFDTLFLWNICKNTYDVHRNKKCSFFFYLFLFNNIYKISGIFGYFLER